MKSLPKLIRSFWLVALLALFGLCSTTSTPGITVPAIAYDEGALPTIAYDVPSLSVFDYDVAPAILANERERRGAETSGVFAGFSSFLAAEATAGKSLFPGEGAVRTYDELIAAGSKGDNTTPHPIPSANHMAQYGVSKGDGVTINMEQPFPGVEGRIDKRSPTAQMPT